MSVCARVHTHNSKQQTTNVLNSKCVFANRANWREDKTIQRLKEQEYRQANFQNRNKVHIERQDIRKTGFLWWSLPCVMCTFDVISYKEQNKNSIEKHRLLAHQNRFSCCSILISSDEWENRIWNKERNNKKEGEKKWCSCCCHNCNQSIGHGFLVYYIMT